MSIKSEQIAFHFHFKNYERTRHLQISRSTYYSHLTSLFDVLPSHIYYLEYIHWTLAHSTENLIVEVQTSFFPTSVFDFIYSYYYYLVLEDHQVSPEIAKLSKILCATQMEQPADIFKARQADPF